MPQMSCQAIATDPHAGDHVVQLYEDERLLASAIGPFLSTGLARWDGVVVVATTPNWMLLASGLQDRGIDVAAAIEQRQLVVRDATDLLTTFMVDGMPDAARFHDRVGGLVREMVARYPRVRIYGEMVNLLWVEGQVPAAIRVEELWNDLAKTHAFSLFCSYRMDGFDRALYQGTLQDLCRTHSHTFPVEDSDRLDRAIDRALGDILGTSQAHALRASLEASRRSSTQMPPSQALLFWLREQMPTMADAVLVRARQYYRNDPLPAGAAA